MSSPADSPVHSNIEARFPQAMERAARVRLMIFDVDGVLTDGRLLVGPQGEISKAFDTLDGHGIKLLAQAGITPAIITGRESEIVAWRAGELGIEHLYQGVADKREAFVHLLAATALQPADAGYMGDDWPDLPVMAQVGFAACPAQAHAEVRSRCHYVTRATGGRGAAREVADLILKAQGAYDDLLAQLLQAPNAP
ncbi:KdsC family phosphatase [Ralstonia pseudosolanacearum]|uniref:KdsC family phosphatase n=1 Tax=Ralstonia pseudosolanacearum TaxID=1310165 RepID=UPI001FFB7F90|nr:HAD family hydrolase [Ralstonia pseudosolanacearum]